MPGYGPAAMVQTPWGNAADLRGRRLRPGPGTPAAEVAENQRERFYAATVAVVADKGYEATTVADLLALSGVSRASFYEHFRDKEECVLATFAAIAAMGGELVSKRMARSGTAEERARSATIEVFAAIARQPAAAQLAFLEISAAGPTALAALNEAMARFTAQAVEAFGEIPGHGGLSTELVRALLGGARTVVRSRLHGGEAETVAGLGEELWEWAMGYEPPHTPLRSPGRRRQDRGWVPGTTPLAAYNPAERIIRALAAASAERGYAAVTLGEIAARASVSKATLSAHFASKEDALTAALDSTTTQMLAVAMPAIRRAPDWPNSVRAAIGAFFSFGAAEPDLARLASAGVYATNPRAIAQRRRTMERLRALFAPGYELAPGAPRIAAEAIIGAVFSIAYERILAKGPESLPEVAPLAAYVTLAPFIGAKAASEVADGDGLARAVPQP